MILLDGKQTSARIRAELKNEVQLLAQEHGRAPGLAVLLVGDDPASQVYVRNKEKACKETGIASRVLRLPEQISQPQLQGHIRSINQDARIDGILLQLPLPRHLDVQACLEFISPDKDVDGFHPQNMGRLALGLSGFLPCTPAGIMVLLKAYGLSPAGKKAVVVGRSNIVGKPLALLLSRPGQWADATVTICHSRTPDLAEETRRADFLFLAMGKPRFVGPDMVKPGSVVVDVGISRTDKGLAGDADFEALRDKVSAMTPVPGGVGPMTIAQLLVNSVQAFKQHIVG